MSDLEKRLREQLPALAAKMIESHAANPDEPVASIWPRRHKARRVLQLAAVIVVLAAAAGAIGVLLNRPTEVITTTPPTTSPPVDATPVPTAVPIEATPASPTTEPESTPTTQPEPEPAPLEPEPAEPESEPAPTTEPPATTLPDEPEPTPETDSELEPPVDGNDQTGSDESAVSAEALDSAERVSRISHVRRLPWGEGFLQVGYPVVDEDRVDRTRLFSRVSTDGLDWSPLERLPIRLPDLQRDDRPGLWPYRRGSVMITASDGERLVLAVFGEDTVVAITSDLTRWETFEIPAPSREALPDGVTAEPSTIDLAIGPEGWLLLREVQLGVDLWELAPADIRDSAQDIEFGFPESQGLIVRWQTSEQEPAEPYHSRFVTWEELGIDEDTYLEYGAIHFSNKPYSPSWLASGEVWAAEWGNPPVRNGLPDVSGGFWSEVVGTDAGYLARSYWGEGGYPQVVGPDYFSADGSNWVRRDTPILNGMPFFADMSVVTDGIVLNGHLFYPPVYPDAATESESQLWLGDATGTNWRPVELPSLSEGSQFDLRHSRGGAVVKGGEPEDDSSVEWMDDSSVEWMMASRDGVNWLVVEDPAVGDLSGFVVSGNVMLAFDSQGNTHRFLLP